MHKCVTTFYLDLRVANFLVEPILQIWTCSNGMHWTIMLWVVFQMEMSPKMMQTIWAFGENYRARTEEVLLHAERKLKLDFWMDTSDYHLWYVFNSEALRLRATSMLETVYVADKFEMLVFNSLHWKSHQNYDSFTPLTTVTISYATYCCHQHHGFLPIFNSHLGSRR